MALHTFCSPQVETDSFWNAYYASARQGDSPLTDAPSSFIQFCASHVRPGGKVVEFGCGNGRDARWFLVQGCAYVGVDACGAAVDRCRTSVGGGGRAKTAKPCTFQTGDFADPDLLAAESGTFDVVYSRFTLHSVTDEQETQAVANAVRLLKPGGRFMLEARSTRDPRCGAGRCVGPNAYVDTHYRRFLELDGIVAKCEAARFEVVAACEEVRAANFLDDKAVVVRLIAAKPALTEQVVGAEAGATHDDQHAGRGDGGAVVNGRENVAPRA